jgi:hypothetical protein
MPRLFQGSPFGKAASICKSADDEESEKNALPEISISKLAAISS